MKFDFGFSKCAQFFTDLAEQDIFLCIGLATIIILLMLCIIIGIIFGIRSTYLHGKDVDNKNK